MTFNSYEFQKSVKVQLDRIPAADETITFYEFKIIYDSQIEKLGLKMDKK
jgi:hypothetical protein